jgi:hypothetical protein
MLSTSAGQLRDEYYQARIRLVDLIAERNRALRSLNRMILQTVDEHPWAGVLGEFDMLRAQELLSTVSELESQIAGATDLVNRYAGQIGSPPIARQGGPPAGAVESDDK